MFGFSYFLKNKVLNKTFLVLKICNLQSCIAIFGLLRYNFVNLMYLYKIDIKF